MSDIAFAKMVMKLAADVRALEDRTGPFGREAIRKKLNTARALSDALWTKMGAEGIDPLRYREILIDIEYGLENIQVHLDRPNTTLWGRIADLFVSAIEFWADLFGLNLRPRLSHRPALPALTFDDGAAAETPAQTPNAKKPRKPKK